MFKNLLTSFREDCKGNNDNMCSQRKSQVTMMEQETVSTRVRMAPLRLRARCKTKVAKSTSSDVRSQQRTVRAKDDTVLLPCCRRVRMNDIPVRKPSMTHYRTFRALSEFYVLLCLGILASLAVSAILLTSQAIEAYTVRIHGH